jgi:hypothetical protein
MALTRTEFSQALRKGIHDSIDHVQLRADQERKLQLAFASWIRHVRATYQLVLVEPDGVLFQRASRRPQKAMDADAVRFLRALLLTPASELDPTAPRLAFDSNYGHNCTRSFGINKVRAALDAAMSKLESELNVAVGALRQRAPVLVSFRRPCDSNPRLPEDATDDFVNSAEWTEAFAKPNAGMIWEAMRLTQCVDAAGFLGRCLLIGAHDVDLQAACSAEIDFMYGSQGALKRLFESLDPASLIISGLSATTSRVLWPRKPLLGCLAVSELQCAGRQEEAGGNELAVAQLINLGFSEEASRQVRTSGFVPGAANSISSGENSVRFHASI